jgi:hypothetical protein
VAAQSPSGRGEEACGRGDAVTAHPLIARDDQRQLVGDEDDCVARLQLRWHHQGRLLLLWVGWIAGRRQLQKGAQDCRHGVALQCVEHVAQIALEADLPRLDHARIEAVEHVPP